VGPYRIETLPCPRAKLKRPDRWRAGAIGDGPLNIASDAPPAVQLDMFMRQILSAIHYKSGLNESSNEESFTHATAAGLVEIAHRNPEFWVQFNGLIGQHLGQTRHAWHLRAAGHGATPPAPKRIVVGTDAYSFVPLEDDHMNWAFCDYDHSRIEISPRIEGPQMPVVVMHECLHALHHEYGLGDRTLVSVFTRGQAKAILAFARHNPRFWSWWLHSVHASQHPVSAT
jgi:hypothetical protein